MKGKRIHYGILMIALTVSLVVFYARNNTRDKGYTTMELEKPITPDSEAFSTMMQVLTHPRCINCHPTDNIPKQGDDGHIHYFGLKRGAKDHGFDALQCATCHQEENNNYSGVPGAPHWGLAPASMGWQGLTQAEIANALIDRTKNGDRSPEDLIKHMTEDALVLWAWEPGVNAEGVPREPPPVSKEDFANAVKTWFEQGAVIPE